MSSDKPDGLAAVLAVLLQLLPGGLWCAWWLWAVNLPSSPMAASTVAWPRPGRDSCNSRSTGAPCP